MVVVVGDDETRLAWRGDKRMKTEWSSVQETAIEKNCAKLLCQRARQVRRQCPTPPTAQLAAAGSPGAG